MQEPPALDPFGQAYARLSFGLERHVPGFIDAWLGSAAERAALEPASAPPAADLVAEAGALKAQAVSLDTNPQRREYLRKQITAMETVARTLAGEQFPYRDEVRLLFDVEPAVKPEAMFDDAIRELDTLVPGDGPVLERLAEWRAQYIISPETARRVVDVILPELRASMAKGPVKVVAIVDETKLQQGAMAFIENTVDPNTGTVTAKARMANANKLLWPGQFVKGEVVLGVEDEALSVPAAAVQLGPQGPYVFIVKDGTVELRQVVVKRTQNGESVIGKGVEAGESVVIDGQLRLVNGATVSVRPPQVEQAKPPAPPRG